MTRKSPASGTKFMQSLSSPIERNLRIIAKKRGITLQELIRAEIVPGWLRQQNGLEGTIDIDRLIHLIQHRLNGKHSRKAKALASTRDRKAR